MPTDHFNLRGRTALVTGGNVGIGRAICLALAEVGVDIVLTYHSHRDAGTAEEVRSHGVQGVALALDATNSSQVKEVVDDAAQHLGGHIDILVNNAGGLPTEARVPFADMTDDQWRTVIDLNLTSAFFTSRAVLRFMTTGWGRIINISSIAAVDGGGPPGGAYATAKAGVNVFTVALAKQVADRGITVNAIAPGFIVDTPFHENAPKEHILATAARTPLQRVGRPADIAGAVVFLASDQASFVTAEILNVNGGIQVPRMDRFVLRD
jgi:3-oxoacyl-[acyl-carrier protein] reductase